MKPIDIGLYEAAKRASDIVNVFRAHRPWDELQYKWLAFRLDTGENDGTLYDTRRDAVRHQRDERLCAYLSFKNLMAGTTPRDMAIFFQFHREAYDSGLRLTDPDHQQGGREALITSAQRDYYREQLGI